MIANVKLTYQKAILLIYTYTMSLLEETNIIIFQVLQLQYRRFYSVNECHIEYIQIILNILWFI